MTSSDFPVSDSKFQKLNNALLAFEAYSRVQGFGHSFLKIDKDLNFSISGDKKGAVSIRDAAKAILELAKELPADQSLTHFQTSSLKNRISTLKETYDSSGLRVSDKPGYFFETALAQVDKISVAASSPQAASSRKTLNDLHAIKKNITDKLLQGIQEEEEEPASPPKAAKPSVDAMRSKFQEDNSKELVHDLKENITKACKELSPTVKAAVQRSFDETAQKKLSLLIEQYEDGKIPHRYEAFQLALIETFQDIIRDLAEPQKEAIQTSKAFVELSTEPKSMAFIDAFLDRSVDEAPTRKQKNELDAEIHPKTVGGEHDYIYLDEEGEPWRADYATEHSIRDELKGKVAPETFEEILSSPEELKDHQIFHVLTDLIKNECTALPIKQREQADMMVKVAGKQGFSSILNQVLDDIETEKITEEEAPQKVREYLNAAFMSAVEKEGDAAEGRKQLVNLKFDQEVTNKLDQALEKIVSDPIFQEVLSRYMDENL